MSTPRARVSGCVLCLLAATAAWAASPAKEQAIESSAGAPGFASGELPTTEQLLTVLKQRAETAIKARRAQAPRLITANTSLAYGFDNNVNLDSSRKGDGYLEEAAGLAIRPHLTPWLGLEGSYQIRNTHYTQFTDNNTWSNTLGALARWTPHPHVSLEAGYEYEIFNYPFDTSNSFFDHRVTLRLRHILNHVFFHEASWGYLLRNYDTRKASDPSGTETPSVREDQRQTVGYELGAILGETVVRLKQEWYENLSNEGLEDFYDWQDYRVRLSASRQWWQKLLTTASAAYERRNYARRSVPTKNVAEKDDLATLSVSLFYAVANHWDVGYTWLWREQVSNDPRLDFADTIHQWGVYGRF
ncbi:MAG: DUF560 domain-containing protein [Candidatus Omnitrophica bacterium]|nr:DUF560 domain-containing protein [Candidatus Omnitrophota bacterium]